MILNARKNLFFPHFSKGFFYPEIEEKWLPIIQRLKIPYINVTDYMNACVQSISLPNINIPEVNQQQGQYTSSWTNGKELPEIINRSLEITFKLSESFYSYWIMYDQIDLFLKRANKNNQDNKPPYWTDFFISYLDNAGFEQIRFEYKLIIPINLSGIEISYSNNIAEYSTFRVELRYNRYNIFTPSLKNIKLL